MSKHIEIAYCGGKMTCNGYVPPTSGNVDYSGYTENPTSITNKTDADAFVYTYYDDGDTPTENPSSKLYVIKSCCKPYMSCTYYDGEDVNNMNIINDSSKVWAKEVDAKYIVNFPEGEFIPSEDVSKKYVGVTGSAISYASQNDINTYRTNISNSRLETLKSIIIAKGVSESNISSNTVTNIGDTTISFRSGGTLSSVTVSFKDYTSELTTSSFNTLNAIIFQNSAVTITFRLSSYEANVSNFAKKRLNSIDEACGTNFSGNGTSKTGTTSTVHIYASHTVFSNYSGFTNNDIRIEKTYQGATSAKFHFINDSSTNDVPSATTPSMFSDCNQLVTCEIPCQMRYINQNTFRNCEKLTSYTNNPEFLDVIDSNAFNGSGIITAKLGNFTVLKASAFTNCQALTTIEWNNNETSGGNRCRVNDWESLIYGANHTKVIPNDCFKNCYSLSKTKLSSSDSLSNSIIIPKGFNEIGISAFENCSAITAVNLNGVTVLNDRAFLNCTGIQSISGMSNVTYIGSEVFQPTDSTGSVITIYGSDQFDSVQAIDSYAFQNKTLSSTVSNGILNLPSATSVGQYAFSGATINGHLNITGTSNTVLNNYSFANANINNGGVQLNNCSIDSNAFNSVHIIGDTSIFNSTVEDYSFISSNINGNLYVNVGLIKEYAFYASHINGNCNISANTIDYRTFMHAIANTFNVSASTISGSAFASATTNTFNVTANTIADSAFTNVTASTSLNVDNASIGDYAFRNSILSAVSLNSISGLGAYAFSGSNLKSVSMNGKSSSSQLSIGDNAFYNCSSLTSVTIGNYVSSIGSKSFSGCSSLRSVSISNGLTSIGSSAFTTCTNLTALTIPNSVTSIGEAAFYNCSGLTSIDIPSGVTSIGNNTFRGCSGLTSVTIGSGVTSIGNYAFNGCINLSSITFTSSVAPSVQNYSFNNVKTSGTLYVPNGSTSYDAWIGTILPQDWTISYY